ncbi:MetQ/NlpA family lipoprotein [Paraburkholderia adhaesiva]|uniref:MetQ/NlpA family lipoprotein n=1 Tax=Paraburkholderia adhaesiva TaxID=2883244 RepID=UPI001F2DD3C8|nr:MetQ/NlpA family lipoprotein [Paraburkholderia adhaesiva]
MTQAFRLLAAATAAFAFAAAHAVALPSTAILSDSPASVSRDRVVRIGVTPGTHAQVMDEVKRVAAARGLPLEIVVFEDPARIDAALAAGRIDAASFENASNLAHAIETQRYPLTNIAPTITLPMAFYSRQLRRMTELHHGATVAIPADPQGMARALVLLQNYTLITFRDSAGLHASLRDITSNRLHLKFIAVPQTRLYAALDTSAFVAMDSADAQRAGLLPARDSVGIEDARSPYADVLAVRTADRTSPWVRELVASYHSEDVAHFILAHYQDSVRLPW